MVPADQSPTNQPNAGMAFSPRAVRKERIRIGAANYQKQKRGTASFGKRYAITCLNALTNDSISDFFPIAKRMWFGKAGNKRPT